MKPKNRVVKSNHTVSQVTAKGIVSNSNAMKNLSGRQINARLRQALKNEKAYNTQALKKTQSRVTGATVLGSQGIATSANRNSNQDLIDAGAEQTTRDNSTNTEGRWYVE